LSDSDSGDADGDCNRAGELLDTTEKQPDSEDVHESAAIDVSPVVTVDVVSSVFWWRW